jgi:hypothetical protein
MKTGKYIPLGIYKNVKIGYGTVDFKNLKTIYLKLNSWVQPEDLNEDDDDVDFNYLITKSRRLIKELIYNLRNENFKPQSRKQSICDECYFKSIDKRLNKKRKHYATNINTKI